MLSTSQLLATVHDSFKLDWRGNKFRHRGVRVLESIGWDRTICQPLSLFFPHTEHGLENLKKAEFLVHSMLNVHGFRPGCSTKGTAFCEPGNNQRNSKLSNSGPLGLFIMVNTKIHSLVEEGVVSIIHNHKSRKWVRNAQMLHDAVVKGELQDVFPKEDILAFRRCHEMELPLCSKVETVRNSILEKQKMQKKLHQQKITQFAPQRQQCSAF